MLDMKQTYYVFTAIATLFFYLSFKFSGKY